jgi:hypothetical protein
MAASADDISGNTNTDPPDVEFVDVLGTRNYPNASAVYVDENCDGIDGVIGDALFVRAGAPPGGTGTRAQPFATIGAALTAFPTSSKAYILVATGIYAESVTVIQGVELHGGYSSDFSRRNIVSFPTVIAPVAPVPGTYTAAVIASDITGSSETVVSGFVLRGYDVAYTPASGPGGTTYAAHITDSDDSLVLVNNRVVGGEGGRGARGRQQRRGLRCVLGRRRCSQRRERQQPARRRPGLPRWRMPDGEPGNGWRGGHEPLLQCRERHLGWERGVPGVPARVLRAPHPWPRR